MGGGGDGAAPASLVEGMDCDASGLEVGEEVVVVVAVVREAVEKEEAGGFGGGLGSLVLRGKRGEENHTFQVLV